MDFNRTTLVQKIMAKGVILSPFEAIHLKYLSRKGILSDLINVARTDDPYKAIEERTGPISPYMVSYFAQRAQAESPDEYRIYNSAYESLISEDENCSKQAYMGLMLITQLRLIKAEFQNYFPTRTSGSLLEFDSYSYYHQDIKTFSQVLNTLGETFQFFIQDIDSVLTLNYFLSRLIDLEDLNCLRYLRMWLSKPKSNCDQDFEHLNGAYLCCSPEIINLVLDRNHKNFISFMERRYGRLPMNFEVESLKYVQDVLSIIVQTQS